MLICLSDRTKLAKILKADLFISLHCNDSNNRIKEEFKYIWPALYHTVLKKFTWFAYRLQNQFKKRLGSLPIKI